MANIYPKDFFKSLNNKVDRATCFVLMPFDNKFKPVYDTIKETLQSSELNFICNRADDIYQPHIAETILKNLFKAEFIIADLTDKNSNVFYEIGIAHCVKDVSKVVILTQSLDNIPFDLRQFRCIVYEQSDSGLLSLKKELIKTFAAAAKHSFRIKVKENRTIPFDKKLAGKDRNFYQLQIETPHIGHGAVKIIIHFTQIRIDKDPDPIEPQFIFVTHDEPTKKIHNIPWTISLIQIDEGNTQATVSLDIE